MEKKQTIADLAKNLMNKRMEVIKLECEFYERIREEQCFNCEFSSRDFTYGGNFCIKNVQTYRRADYIMTEALGPCGFHKIKEMRVSESACYPKVCRHREQSSECPGPTQDGHCGSCKPKKDK